MHSEFLVLLSGSLSLLLPGPAVTGEFLGRWWLVHALTLAMGSALFGHLTLFLIFSILAKRAKAPSRWLRALSLPFEIYFCLLNPLAYLLIFTRSSGETGFFADVVQSDLDPVAAGILLGVWSLRLVPAIRHPKFIRALLYLCLLWLGLYAIKDCLLLAALPSIPLSGESLAPVFLLGNICLYLTPMAILAGYLRRRRADGAWAGGDDFFLLPPTYGAPVALVGTFLVYGFYLILTAHPSEAEARAKLEEYRETIIEAAQRYDLEPRHLGALIYVVNREQASPFARYLESMAMGAWLSDSHNLLLYDSLNLSIGLTQIKPITARTALLIVQTSHSQETVAPTNDYLEIPTLDESWLLPRNSLETLQPPAINPLVIPRYQGLPKKTVVVKALGDEPTSITMAAYILGLYAAQWESASPEWSIRSRPDILASLYQLGFERSQPKADPQSLPFGERVADVAASEWMQEIIEPP